MNQIATYEAMHAAHEGRMVEHKGTNYTIGALLERMGKLKTGDEKAYVLLTAADGTTVEMHPRKAVDLFTKGEAEGIKLLVEQVAAEGEMKATPTEVVSQPEQAKPEETTATTEVAVAGATTPATAEVVAIATPAVPAAPKMKALCIVAYHAGVAANKSRAQILSDFAAIGVTSKPGQATYYQNCKSGKSGWTLPVVQVAPAVDPVTTKTE